MLTELLNILDTNTAKYKKPKLFLKIVLCIKLSVYTILILFVFKKLD